MRVLVPRRSAFTLIELLVTISIIAVLIAIVLPALGAARSSARQVLCASNLKQLALAGHTYATEHRQQLPPGAPGSTYAPALFYLPAAGYDLRENFRDYLQGFAAWKCPTVGPATDIDDAANTRFACYNTYGYLPGRSTPALIPGQTNPINLDEATNPSRTVFQQDTVRDGTFGAFEFNHGVGETITIGATNPSMIITAGIGVAGANLSFFDGHAEWYDFTRLQPVGPILQGTPNQYYSPRP